MYVAIFVATVACGLAAVVTLALAWVDAPRTGKRTQGIATYGKERR